MSVFEFLAVIACCLLVAFVAWFVCGGPESEERDEGRAEVDR
jgi:hypothetical protein